MYSSSFTPTSAKRKRRASPSSSSSFLRRGSGVATLESPPPLTALQPNDFYSAEDHGPGVFHLQNLFDETTRGNLTYLLNSGRGSEHDLKSADAAADSVLAMVEVCEEKAQADIAAASTTLASCTRVKNQVMNAKGFVTSSLGVVNVADLQPSEYSTHNIERVLKMIGSITTSTLIHMRTVLKIHSIDDVESVLPSVLRHVLRFLSHNDISKNPQFQARLIALKAKNILPSETQNRMLFGKDLNDMTIKALFSLYLEVEGCEEGSRNGEFRFAYARTPGENPWKPRQSMSGSTGLSDATMSAGITGNQSAFSPTPFAPPAASSVRHHASHSTPVGPTSLAFTNMQSPTSHHASSGGAFSIGTTSPNTKKKKKSAFMRRHQETPSDAPMEDASSGHPSI